MKTKSFYIAIIYCFGFIYCYAQTQTTIYTPQNTPVTAYYQIPEMSSEDKEQWSDDVEYYYPSASEQNAPSATNSYNCHGYAWHVSGGGSNRWIGYYVGQEDHEDEYWEDVSYIRVSSESIAEKISYYADNHSAVQTSTQGTYISKWGPGPLMQHTRDYGPEGYNMDYRYYYAKPKITGSSLICYSAGGTYSVQNFSGVTYSWSKSDNLTFTSSTSGRTISVRPSSSGISGSAYVEVTITVTAYNETNIIRKDFWVGKVDGAKIVSSREGQAVGAWAQYHLLCDEGTTEVVAGYDSNGDGEMIGDSYYSSYQSITGYEWNFPSGWSYYDTYEGITNEYIDVSPDGSTYPQPGQMVQVGIRAQNGCGWSNWKYDYWQVISCGGGWYMSVSPNPSNGMVTVSINNKSKTYNSRIDENITWVLDVYNINQPRLKERITKLQGSSTTINTSGWEKGIYIVQARYKDKVLQAKLVVE